MVEIEIVQISEQCLKFGKVLKNLGKYDNQVRLSPSLYGDSPAGAPHGLQVRPLDADQAIELHKDR